MKRTILLSSRDQRHLLLACLLGSCSGALLLVAGLELLQLIGINNRDLASFHTDLATTEQLTARYGDQIRAKGCLLVSESGLRSRDDLDRVQSAGADAVLVGESLMRQPDVTAALETLISG